VGKVDDAANQMVAVQDGERRFADEQLENLSAGINVEQTLEFSTPAEELEPNLDSYKNPYRCYCVAGRRCQMHAFISFLPEARH